MKIEVVNTEGLTKFESALVKLVNGCSFDRKFLDEERGKYAAKKLSGIAVEEYKQSLWKPADGDDLPEIDREVIVLRCPYQLNPLAYSVSFAHRPDPNGWTGKSISTGEIKHYEAKTFDKGGWSIPGVRWWLDLKLPEGGEK